MHPYRYRVVAWIWSVWWCGEITLRLSRLTKSVHWLGCHQASATVQVSFPRFSSPNWRTRRRPKRSLITEARGPALRDHKTRDRFSDASAMQGRWLKPGGLHDTAI